MGMANMAHIVKQLIQNGRSPSTPVAVISQGTSPKQRTIVGALENIVAKAKKENFEPPAVIVVGEVVRLREKLRWFDNLPLFGRRVLVTRAEHQAKELSQLLLSRGALPLQMPVIEMNPPRSWGELDRAIRNLKSYGWTVFTSVNAVEILWKRLYGLGLDSRWLAHTKIGAIGPATAAVLEARGIHPDYVPEIYTSQGFLAGLKKKDIADCKVLLPRTDIADNEISDGLAGLGAEVHQVTAYRTTAARSASPAKQMLLKGEIDVITFTSASTVHNLLAMLGQKWEVIRKAKLACIGRRQPKFLQIRALSLI